MRRSLPFVVGGMLVLLLLGALAGCKANASAFAQPTATNATLAITVQNARFGLSDPLGVQITNNGKKNVYAVDGKASCTFLQLQQYQTQSHDWVAINQCRDTLPPHVLLIRAGMTESFTLPPASSSDPNAWSPGNYRVALSFSTQPDGTSDAQMAYSQGFAIKGS